MEIIHFSLSNTHYPPPPPLVRYQLPLHETSYNQPMHELPVTQSILDIALRHAGQAGAKRITDLHIILGELSTNVDDSIQFYWDIIARGTIAEGARLHFVRIPAKMQCLDCIQEYVPGEEFLCPACRSPRVKVIAGDEFRLDAIDVDDGTESQTS